ncbi:MAG TPA: MarR family transcriptional regulator [Longimicrobium sp.]|nr:MarR family transcriptional regulator [Longimicrobium sp.]
MSGRIQAELKQTKPFGSLEEEAYLNVMRTSNALNQGIADLLRGYDLTQAQYNVLRILRGAGESGLNASEIAGRMISRDPDVTRLVDRLEKRGLVDRWRCSEDRRVVWTRISQTGLDLINPIDAPLNELHRRLLSHLSREKLQTLIELLEEARDGA